MAYIKIGTTFVPAFQLLPFSLAILYTMILFLIMADADPSGFGWFFFFFLHLLNVPSHFSSGALGTKERRVTRGTL